MGELVPILLAISAVAVISWVWKVFHWVWWKPLKLQRNMREQGIRGPPYRLLYGDIKDNISATKDAISKPMELSHRILPRIYPFIHQTVQKYGRLSINWYGPTPRITVTDPDHVRDILANKSGDFAKKKITPVGKLLIGGLVTYEGKKWVKHRRIISPAFHLEKLKMMLPAFHTSCIEMVSKWQKLAPEGSSELNVWPEFQNLTGDVISRTAFGSSYEEGRHIFQLQAELAELTVQSVKAVFLPGFRFVPTKTNKRMKEIDVEVKTLLRGIISKRQKAAANGEANNDDLLGLLMESNLKEIQDDENHKNVGMTIDDIVEECKLFYFAGQETTACLLVWSMIILGMHPEWQVHAREEVLQVFGKGKLNFDGLNHLKIMTMILYEVLRLYPPFPLLTRATYTTVKLGNLCLPPGLELTIPTLLIHRDPEHWGQDAEEFNPGRFSDGVLNATKNRNTFFPFGWGPRICIGQTFSMIEAKMALAMILQQFSFELSATYVHAPYAVITLQPQHGAQITLHRL